MNRHDEPLYHQPYNSPSINHIIHDAWEWQATPWSSKNGWLICNQPSIHPLLSHRFLINHSSTTYSHDVAMTRFPSIRWLLAMVNGSEWLMLVIASPRSRCALRPAGLLGAPNAWGSVASLGVGRWPGPRAAVEVSLLVVMVKDD